MKKLFLVLFLGVLCFPAFCQRRQNITWFDIAPKGGIGSTVLYNRSILTDNNVKIDMLSPSYFLALKVGFTVNEITSIYFEGGTSNVTQSYEIENAGYRQNIAYTKKLELTLYDVGFFFRATSLTGIYGEIGPRITFFNSIAATNDPVDAIIVDLGTEDYKKRATCIVGGLGMAILRSPDDRVRFNVGLRGVYCLDNITADVAHTPLKDGLYELNIDYNSRYNNTNKTAPIGVFLMFELDYFIGYYGRARCGKTKLNLFK